MDQSISNNIESSPMVSRSFTVVLPHFDGIHQLSCGRHQSEYLGSSSALSLGSSLPGLLHNAFKIHGELLSPCHPASF